jgi:intracellular septation protein
METLIELAPLIAFFIAYKFFGGIYVATGVLMVAMALLLAYDWLRTRKLPQMHLVSAVLVWVFGIATLLLRDVRFIQWKATVFYWLVALAVGVTVSAARWRNMSLVAAAFYLALGALNLWVAYTMSEPTWVFFKTWIVVPLLLVFTFGLVLWIMRGQQPQTT